MTTQKSDFIIVLVKRKGARMKKDLLWAKTLLSVYRYLERLCSSIDKIINRTGLSSINVNSQTFYYNNVYSITQRIIDLSHRKVTLINLKLLIEDILQKMRSNEAKCLISRYVDGAKRRVMAEHESVSLRTIFRRIERAENSFSKILQAKGYDEAKICKMLADEQWIHNVYNRLAEKDEEDFCLSSLFLQRAVSI